MSLNGCFCGIWAILCLPQCQRIILKDICRIATTWLNHRGYSRRCRRWEQICRYGNVTAAGYNSLSVFTSGRSAVCVFRRHMHSPAAPFSLSLVLTHWGRDKMAAIFQTTFSTAFSWMKMLKSRLKFHWCLFLRVQSTIFQHWFG